jgi:signal transduction histidine kinase
MVELSVEDRGPGIGEEEAIAIFEPFYRGASARDSRVAGSGLGLAIVKRTMETQGGWIELDRSTTRGCRFRLVFIADAASEYDPAESEVAG